jgi:hypothetical protein
MGKIVVKAVPNSVRICVIALSINAFRLIINLFNQEQCDNTKSQGHYGFHSFPVFD